MDDYALVLNAGSSSLKFCIFRGPRDESWHLDVRGQVEGIIPTNEELMIARHTGALLGLATTTR